MTLTAVLLAGGLSQRMGRDKATLLLDGQPLWARQLALLTALRPERILVSARSVPSWVPPELAVVLDAPPSRGPLSGIAAALGELRSSHLLALAIDLPRITTEHLRRLTALAKPSQGVIPANQDHLEPLVALYPKEAAGLAQLAAVSQDVSMHSFARDLLQRQLLTPYPLRPEEVALYLNVNTPEELQPTSLDRPKPT